MGEARSNRVDMEGGVRSQWALKVLGNTEEAVMTRDWKEMKLEAGKPIKILLH